MTNEGSSSNTLPPISDRLNDYPEWSRVFICVERDGEGGDLEILASKHIEPTARDISEVETAFNSYDATMSKGMYIGDDHFDVHRFHDNLVYGRRGNPATGDSEGFCIAKLDETKYEGKCVYGAITYRLPDISAREIPRLQELLKLYYAPEENNE